MILLNAKELYHHNNKTEIILKTKPLPSNTIVRQLRRHFLQSLYILASLLQSIRNYLFFIAKLVPLIQFLLPSTPVEED